MSARLRLVKPRRRRSGAPGGPNPAAIKDRAPLTMELVDDMEDWLVRNARMRRILQCPLVTPRWLLRLDARNPEGRRELGLSGEGDTDLRQQLRDSHRSTESGGKRRSVGAGGDRASRVPGWRRLRDRFLMT